MRRSGVVALALAAILTAPGCGGGGGGEGAEEQGDVRQGGTLTVALAEDPDALDPSLARTFVGRIVFASFCEKLYDVNENLEVVPQLAASLPEVSDDAKTVTIKLRTGIKFNDGTPFDAEAVKAALDRHRTHAESTRASELEPVESVDAVDASTVVLNLKRPFSPLTGILADRAGMIMSPAQVEKLGDNFARDPVCVGPFQFVDRVEGSRITVKKAPDFYDADKVKLDRIVYRIIEEGSVRASNLRSGDADVAERLEATDVQAIEDDPNLDLQEATSIGYQGLTLNIGNANGVGEPPGEVDTALGQSAQLREAFDLSLDRDTIARVVFQDGVVPGCAPFAPGTPYFLDDFDCPQQDVERAKQLVEESGASTPVPVTLMLGTDAVTLRLGQTIQSMAKDAGFAVKLQPTEFTASLDKSDAGQYDVFQIGWSGRVDPDANFHQFVTSKGSLNVSGSANPEIDRLLDDARVEQDMDARKDLYQQAVEIVALRDRPLIYLYHQTLFTGTAKKVVGLNVYGDGILRLTEAGFAAG
jgi:peptide/nickel transport system substrate-binding protein